MAASQCRTPRCSGHVHFCYFHAQKEAESLAAQQVGEDISRFLPTKLLTACDLGVAMSRLFCAVAQGQIKQEYKIDLVTALEYDSRPTGESMANSPKRDWTGIFAGCVFVGGLLWAAHSEISKMDERIANVDKHIGRVETAVRIMGAKQGGDTKTLIDEALTVAKNAADAGRTESAKAVLDIANRLLADQKASKVPAPQSFFDSTIKSYQKLQKSPALSDSAWDGATKLAEYRSSTSSVPPGIVVHIGELSQKGPFRYLKDSFISGPHAIAFGTEKGFVLDGFYLDNVVFENTNIIYHGGPVILQNVRFVNCTFEAKRSPQSEKLLEAATKESVNAAIG